LRRRAKIIEAEMSLGRAEIESLRGSDKGSVRVGVGPSFVGRIMPIAMLRMHEAHPEVQIAAVIDTSVGLYPQLLRGELEFVVSAPATSLTIEPDIQLEKLFLDRDCAVVRADHPLARKRKVSLADTQDYPWLLSARTGPSLSRVAREFTALGLAPPTRVLRTDSTLLGLELVRRGDCILLVSRENIEREMTAKQLVELDVPRVAEVRPAYIAKRQRSPLQPAAAQLLEHVRQVCFELYGHAN
jgi:DNA-binding transcriptional LysR family regulator